MGFTVEELKQREIQKLVLWRPDNRGKHSQPPPVADAGHTARKHAQTEGGFSSHMYLLLRHTAHDASSSARFLCLRRKFSGLNCLFTDTRSLNSSDRVTFGSQQPRGLFYCRVMSQNRVILTRVLQTAFIVSFWNYVSWQFPGSAVDRIVGWWLFKHQFCLAVWQTFTYMSQPTSVVQFIQFNYGRYLGAVVVGTHKLHMATPKGNVWSGCWVCFVSTPHVDRTPL